MLRCQPRNAVVSVIHASHSFIHSADVHVAGQDMSQFRLLDEEPLVFNERYVRVWSVSVSVCCCTSCVTCVWLCVCGMRIMRNVCMVFCVCLCVTCRVYVCVCVTCAWCWYVCVYVYDGAAYHSSVRVPTFVSIEPTKTNNLLWVRRPHLHFHTVMVMGVAGAGRVGSEGGRDENTSFSLFVCLFDRQCCSERGGTLHTS